MRNGEIDNTIFQYIPHNNTNIDMLLAFLS